jgi:hypothetical protein
VGWLHEPAIANQQNAIVLNVVNTSGDIDVPVEDVSALTVALSYGGQTKDLTLEPLGEDTPGQFIAPVIPTIPGEYEIIFGGMLGDTAVDAETHIDEVQSADILQFPAVASTQTRADSGMGSWLSWLGILFGLIGIGIGVSALRKASLR